ncbi:acyl carrier protein [Streptomyces rectiverticillatus]|uniref:acyl carrier protein n=1 Tax=Streptomyces rectiverticillatus TaxID=173860 RepID=UPI0015C2D8B8|nr:acyl carrier protein [Streptomyces rectiverticillatus]
MTYHELTEMLATRFGVARDRMRPEATFTDVGLESLAVAELSVIVSEHTEGDTELLPSMSLASAAAAC